MLDNYMNDQDILLWGTGTELIESVEFDINILHLPDHKLLALIKELREEIEKNNEQIEAN